MLGIVQLILEITEILTLIVTIRTAIQLNYM